MDQFIHELRSMLHSARHAVFFGGAGVSTESGIPDFRSTDGLYNETWQYPPETILSHFFFQQHTQEFYTFYRKKMLFPGAQPNAAHLSLAKLESLDKMHAVITQNIDGLHQAAGSKHVIELHGSVHRNHCTRCHKAYDLQDILSMDMVPVCSCGGVIKPDVVLYGESLPEDALEDAAWSVEKADLMIVGGTSLSVYPAAGFVQEFKGKLVIINRTPTPMDAMADLCIAQPIGETLLKVMEDF